MKKFLLLLLALPLVLAACSKEGPAKIGAAAPDFTLKDASGKETKLSALRGNVVLVNFWATWCPPCREEIPSIARLNAMMAGKPFRLLAVSIDEGGHEPVDRLFAQMGVTLPTLFDSDGKISKKYGTTGVPETFIVDRQGMVVKKVVGAMDWSDPAVVRYLEDLMKG